MSHTKKGFAHVELLIAAIGVLLVITEIWVFTKYDLHYQDNSSPMGIPLLAG